MNLLTPLTIQHFAIFSWYIQSQLCHHQHHPLNHQHGKQMDGSMMDGPVPSQPMTDGLVPRPSQRSLPPSLPHFPPPLIQPNPVMWLSLPKVTVTQFVKSLDWHTITKMIIHILVHMDAFIRMGMHSGDWVGRRNRRVWSFLARRKGVSIVWLYDVTLMVVIAFGPYSFFCCESTLV